MRSRSVLLTALFCVVAISGRVYSQPEPVPKNGRITISLNVSPADYARPASRNYLLPEASEAIQGNSVQMFLRCFMEQDNFYGRDVALMREKWNELPLDQLPLDKVKDYGGRLLERDMYDAARMTNADWQIMYFARRDGFYTLLPDVQKMRSHAAALKTRVRGQIAVHDFDGAIHTLKTMFALARTFENHPTIIGDLVGIAIGSITVNAVEELIAQPACPNLFWSLVDLPKPFLSLRLGIQGERMFVSADFDSFKNADYALPEVMIDKKIKEYSDIFKSAGVLGEGAASAPEATLKARLELRAKDENDVKESRKRLIESGLKAERVNVWSPLHVVLLDDLLIYERLRDEMGKWYNLPFWQAKPGMDAVDADLKKNLDRSVFLQLVPALSKIKVAQARLDQRIAYLKIFEAIRLYAFEHSGALPASLNDVKLPLPIDPVSGKPFEYSVKDGVATVHGENPINGNERTDRYYEIRIKK